MNKEGEEGGDEDTAGLKKRERIPAGGGTYGSDYKPVMSCTSGNQSVGGARPAALVGSPQLLSPSALTLFPPRCHGNRLTQVGPPRPPQKLQRLLVVLVFRTLPAAPV